MNMRGQLTVLFGVLAEVRDKSYSHLGLPIGDNGIVWQGDAGS